MPQRSRTKRGRPQMTREEGLIRLVTLALFVMAAAAGPALADARQEACKKAMNSRIQVCTDDCTRRALTAASDYVDKNNNVKFGCMKGCAIGQILQMRACENGQDAPSGDPTETNR